MTSHHHTLLFELFCNLKRIYEILLVDEATTNIFSRATRNVDPCFREKSTGSKHEDNVNNSMYRINKDMT